MTGLGERSAGPYPGKLQEVGGGRLEGSSGRRRRRGGAIHRRSAAVERQRQRQPKPPLLSRTPVANAARRIAMPSRAPSGRARPRRKAFASSYWRLSFVSLCCLPARTAVSVQRLLSRFRIRLRSEHPYRTISRSTCKRQHARSRRGKSLVACRLCSTHSLRPR